MSAIKLNLIIFIFHFDLLFFVIISVSKKVFDKNQDVIGFLCEIHGPDVTPQSLDDRSFSLNKQRLEKAIRGMSTYGLSVQ